MIDDDRGRDDARTIPDESPTIPRLATMTTFQRDVLWVLAHGAPMGGTTVQHTLEEYYGAPIDHERVVPGLDELVDRGLVDRRKQDERTDEFRLTTQGRRALSRRRAWLERSEAEPRRFPVGASRDDPGGPITSR